MIEGKILGANAEFVHFYLVELVLDLVKLIDDPQKVVDAIFEHYANRSFGPSPDERALELSL